LQLFVGDGLLLVGVGDGLGADVEPDGAGAVDFVPELERGAGFDELARLGAELDVCAAGLDLVEPLPDLSTAVGAPGLAGGM